MNIQFEYSSFSYGVTGRSVEEITQEVNRILEHHHRMMQNVLAGNSGPSARMQFDVSGWNREQKQLLRELRISSSLGGVSSLGLVEMQ
ncbi:MAG TPA: hypothetical protein VGG14_12980 [Candidatus Sulfotelmatobacter sp.]|jgi:hypothetical protein